MINLLFTLLTLAAGIFWGSTGVFVSKKNLTAIKAVFACFGMYFLLLICCLTGAICEERVNPNHWFKFMPLVTTCIILLYGIFLGILFSLKKDIKQEFKKENKTHWITVICSVALIKIPLVLWVIISAITEWNCWNSLVVSIIIGMTVTAVLWILLQFIRLLKFA